jgi:single-strand DNA-binding protein
MAGETITTVIGNLTADPELRFTQSGAAVASFTVASTPRVFKNGDWIDGEALFLRCNAWRQMAENAAESLSRGTRVIVQGRLKQRSFETREGEKRTVVELDVDEIGASIKFKQVTVRESERSGGQQQQRQQRPQQPPEDPWGTPPARPQQQAMDQNDPWASTPPRQQASGFADEPPF